MALSLCIPAFATDVVLSPQNLTVDGKAVTCEKYNIGGANYFKLRDLAQALSGTSSQFEVGWDGATGTVSITTGKAYTSVGGELSAGADKSSTAQVSRQTIQINGVTRSDLSAYNIGGANFFKLRDLGTALGFEVGYDSASNTAIVRNSDSAAKMDSASVLAVADKRRAAILSSETTIVKSDKYVMGETYSGKAYYISNKGSDSNDGLSPQTPLATLERFHGSNRIVLQSGDAIFFERGSVWRAIEMPWELSGTEGLTFSAYGTGAKPAFYGSEENGAGAGKWSLYYSDDSGKKIWVYYREMTEVATIVANGKTSLLRDVAWWDGSSYWKIDGVVYSSPQWWRTEQQYDVTSHLPDLYCFPSLTYPSRSTEQLGERIFMGWDSVTGKKVLSTGPLYLRCDAGNPGELYSSLEFIEPYAFVDGFAKNQTYDNLCVLYSSMTLTSGRNENGANDGGVIQNCEIGWMGGNVFAYATGSETGDTRIQYNFGLYGRNGGTMSVNGCNYTIRNNYIHNSYQEGIALETFSMDKSMENNVVSGNLIERATTGILICNWDETVNPNHIFRNMTVENNMVIYSGNDNFFSSEEEREFCSAVAIQGGPCAAENVVIRNNVFAFASGGLISFWQWSEQYSKMFSGNSYIQYPEPARDSGALYREHGGIILQDDPVSLTESNILKYLGDASATVQITDR